METTLNCDDCLMSVKKERYMVHDELWPQEYNYLCIGCLEKRLGRQLTRTDFTDYPINTRPIKRSERLQSRLQSGMNSFNYYHAYGDNFTMIIMALNENDATMIVLRYLKCENMNMVFDIEEITLNSILYVRFE